MPGVSGAVGAGAPDLLRRMQAALYRPAAGQVVPVRGTAVVGGSAGCAGDAGGACGTMQLAAVSVHSLRPGSGIAARADAWLAFEGWLAEPLQLSGAAACGELPRLLLERFLVHGPRFVEELRGSFQIVAQRGEETFIFADPVASRRLFYLQDRDGRLCFAPEVAPLVAAAGAAPLDGANLLQFLISGRCFAGQTLLAPVRQLLPGEVLVYRAGGAGTRRLERWQHFLYQVEARDRRGADELVEELASRIDLAVRRALSGASRPVFLLSGGYDSRYLFHTAARLALCGDGGTGAGGAGDAGSGADAGSASAAGGAGGAAGAGGGPAGLRSALHGQRMDLPGSDNPAARAVAARYGVHHLTLPWRGELLAEQLDEMFAAQSGMTELVFTHSDELAVFGDLAATHGFDAVLRGDECFGPKGAPVATADEALRRCSMARAAGVAGMEDWFAGSAAPWIEAHDEQMATLLAGAPAAPDALRDTLYARERLPAVAAHHNYHKSHFLEMINPLLDVDLLRFWSALPEPCRTAKRLFRDCYQRRCGDHLEVPIATLDNGVDWRQTLSQTPGLAEMVRRRLLALPAPLDGAWFAAQLDRVVAGGAAAEGGGAGADAIQLPPIKLVARAAVLGLWWEHGLIA